MMRKEFINMSRLLTEIELGVMSTESSQLYIWQALPGDARDNYSTGGNV